MRAQPVTIRRGPVGPPIELCDQTTLFPIDLPVLFGDPSADFPRLCRVDISLVDEPSASVYFAPRQPDGSVDAKERRPILLACTILVTYLARRQECAFDDIPREVDCCFKDTCGFPIVHVTLVGEDDDGYAFIGVLHPELDATEEFAVRFAPEELMLFRA